MGLTLPGAKAPPPKFEFWWFANSNTSRWRPYCGWMARKAPDSEASRAVSVGAVQTSSAQIVYAVNARRHIPREEQRLMQGFGMMCGLQNWHHGDGRGNYLHLFRKNSCRQEQLRRGITDVGARRHSITEMTHATVWV